MSRYKRQITLPEIGPDGQRKIRQTRVLVVGAGGLSATLLPLLAGAGIGHLKLHDADAVEISNLHRQTMFSMDDVGKPKVHCAQQAIQALNPDVTVTAVAEHCTPGNVMQALADVDLVADAADSLAVTYMLSDACLAHDIPLVSASAVQRHGYVGGFCQSAPSYRALFPVPSAPAGNCNTLGVMGPTVATLGSMQAQMVLSIALGLEPSPLGCLITMDFADWRTSRFRFDGMPEPELTIPFIDPASATARDCVVELRSEQEAPESVTDNILRILPDDISNWTPPKDQRLVMVCATGVRASRAAQQLADRGYRRLAVIAASLAEQAQESP